MVAGFVAFLGRIVLSTRYPILPIFLGVGVGLVAYAAYLHEKLADTRYPRGLFEVAAGIVVTYILMMLFWTMTVYAAIEGVNSARYLANQLERLDRVVLFSREDLAFDDRIVTETVGSTTNAYHYKYSGLRLLGLSGTRYLLLPEGWIRGRDSVYVIEERPGLRLEFLTAPTTTPSATTVSTAGETSGRRVPITKDLG